MPSSEPEIFDWDAFMRDTLEASSAATGAWLRCLYKMRLSVTRGRITLPVSSYARLFGSTVEQAKVLIDEIVTLGIGDAEFQSNGNVMLTNRRMFRQWEARKINAERVANWRDKQKEEVSNESVTEVYPTGHSYSLREEEENTKKEEKKEEKKNTSSSPEVARVFSYWQTRLNHPKALLTNDRRRIIQARLKDGYSVEELESAVDGCKQSDYHMGMNDRGLVYDGIDLIFRNGSYVEKFIGYKDQPQQRNGQHQASNGKPTNRSRIEDTKRVIAKYPTEAELAAIGREDKRDDERPE